MLGLGLGIFKGAIARIRQIFGEYFYDFSEQNTNGFTGAGAGEDVISDYLTASGTSTNYFSAVVSPSGSSTIKKYEIEFYIPSNITTAAAYQCLFSDENDFSRLTIADAGGPSGEIIALKVSGGWYYISTPTTLTAGNHTLVIEWTGSTYNFTLDGTTTAATSYLSPVQATINNDIIHIMKRYAGGGNLTADSYISSLKITDDSDNLILDFLNKYGANGTTYNWSGFNFTRVVGDTSKRVTTSVPSQYRIENSSENKEPAIFGNALEFDGIDDYVSIPNLTLTPNFVYSAWVFVKTGQDAVLLENTASGSNNILISTNFSYIRFRNVDFATQKTISITPANWENRWNHVYIYRSSGTVYLYQDGNLIGSVAYAENNIFNTLGASNAWVRADSFIYDECGIALNSIGSGADAASLYNGGNGDYFNNYYTPSAYWRFNGTSGDTTAIDEQGTYNGTLNGFDTDNCWVRHGYYKELAPFTGVAADFDGVSTVIVFGSVVTLDTNATIYFRFKTGNTSFASDTIGAYSSDVQIDAPRFVGATSIRVGRASGSNHNFTVPEYFDAEWHTLAITKEGTSYRMYLDGVESVDGAQTITGTINIDRIGNTYSPFFGQMEDWIIVQETLNSTQIAQLIVRPELTKNYLVNTVGIDWANVAAFYPLTEGGGDIAYDLSDNKNHGTITNPAWVNGLSTGRQLGLQNVSRYAYLPDSNNDNFLLSIPNLTTYSNVKIEVGYISKDNQSVFFADTSSLSNFIGAFDSGTSSPFGNVGTPSIEIDDVPVISQRVLLRNAINDGQFHKVVFDSLNFTTAWGVDTLKVFGYTGTTWSLTGVVCYVKIDLNNDDTWNHVFVGKDLKDSVGTATTTINGIPETITLPEVETISNVPYDTFGLVCNSQNIIVTDGEVEETFALRGEGDSLRYDGHAGSFTNIKQIQLWFNPLDNTDIEYLMTDEENNRIIYLEGNQIKSDFGLAGVYVADVETDIILTDLADDEYQLISVEFTVPVDFEEFVFNGDMVGTPGTFSEFKIDKLNIFKEEV